MTRWLVTVENPDYPETLTAPITGIYVEAETSKEAIAQVRAYIASAKYVAWNKGEAS